MSKDFGLFAPVNGIYDEYKSKLITAKEAASMVKSGMYLHFGLMNAWTFRKPWPREPRNWKT